MRQCNVCGKVISDFAARCPYCDSIISAEKDVEAKKKQKHYSDQRAKRYVIASFLASLIFLFAFRIIFGYIPMFSILSFIEVIIDVACFATAVALIRKYESLSISQNKGFLIAAIIIGILFTVAKFFSTTRLYGMGMFITVGVPPLYMISGVLGYLVSGAVVTTLIIEARFLLRRKPE